MPDFVFRFNPGEKQPDMPEPSAVGFTAAWAAEHGYWDVATCLMELAHALANLERPAPPPLEPPRVSRLCVSGLCSAPSTYVDQAGGFGPAAIVTQAPRCSHGYSVDRAARHIGTGGICGDSPRWCGEPEELGGQQTCPLKTPCPAGACEIGENRTDGADPDEL